MAAVLQKNTEEGILEYVTELRKDYLDEYTCFSGGFFLNILANTIIKNSGLFKEIYIPPFTSDCGLHFGAACYGLFKHKQKINLPKNVALLGKEYNESEIYNEVKNLKHKKYNNFNQLCAETSKLLNENKIIGWFQGKSEFGPRALGSRSILMNPSKKEHKDVINERVKHREYWRPFAGIILDEYLKDYFEDNIQNPYMIYSQTVKSDKKDQLSAIIHEDDTCRIQTVNSELNDKVTTLLKEYHKISGVPVLLNTSFNDNGQPIVETPKDAVDAFLNLDIDYLVIENYIVEK
jgi:carbamoyltransferase